MHVNDRLPAPGTQRLPLACAKGSASDRPVVDIYVPPWKPHLPWTDRATIGIVLVGDQDWLCARHLRSAKGKSRVLSPDAGSVQKCLDRVDGLLINGGPDIHPAYYGKTLNGSQDCHFPDPADAFALDCIREGYRRGLPMLGLCKGMQLMNVAAGGTLVQDIFTQWDDPRVDMHRGPHFIEVTRATPMADVLGTEPLAVNSFHHQAVGDVGDGLTVTARSADGIVEGIASKTNAGQLGVQFHPEVMKDARTERLFQHLVDHGQRYRSQRYNIKPCAVA